MNYPSLSGAITTFLFERSAAGRSLHTLADYRNYLNVFVTYMEDPSLETIERKQVNSFLTYMQYEYHVKRGGKETDQLISPKTLANIQSILSTFWKWACDEFKLPNPCKFERVKFSADPVEPLTEDEVASMFRSVDEPGKAKRAGQRPYDINRKTKKRDRALMMALLDTGARATELCEAQYKDLDIETGRLKVTGKGRKTRFVYFGRKGKNAMWAYLLERFPKGKPDVDAYLFLDKDGQSPLNRDSMRHILLRIGKRAGVTNPHPHRWRHTFTVEYLRNGGDVFTLQQLLGHSTLDMVLRYVQLAQTDMERAHRMGYRNVLYGLRL
jgi:integrase/recombinase XerD